MKYFRVIQFIMFLMVLSLSVSGCIGFQPFPLAARPGDTIGLALGGSPQHETTGGQEITKDDVDITIEQDIDNSGTIDADEIFNVKKRILFRLYPDPVSNAANFSVLYSQPVGEWIAIVNLADPVSGNPLPLIAGQATMRVSTTKLQNLYTSYGLEGDLNNIPIEILPDIGEKHTFNNNQYSNIQDMKPLPHMAISFTGTTNFAAAELDIDYDETAFNDPSSAIRVIQNINKPDVILNYRKYDENGDGKIKIMLYTNNGTSSPNGMKCFIVWNPGYLMSTVVDDGTPDESGDTFKVTNAKFYDENGAEVTGISVGKNLLYQ